MDKYRKCAESLMKLGDEIIADRKRRRTVMLRSLAVGAGAAAVLGIGLTTYALRPPKKPTPSRSGIIAETETALAETTAAQMSPSTTAPKTTATNQGTTTSYGTATTECTTSIASRTIVTAVHTIQTTALQTTMSVSTQQTTTIIQGGVNMKKISAFIAALTTTGLLSPVLSYADATPDSQRIMFTQSELSLFKEYERSNDEGIILDPDINGDGIFDICDVFELNLYGERFTYCFEKYGRDQTKYTELEELYGGEAAERILKCYGAEGSFRFMPVMSGGTDPHNSAGAQILARYYLYKNNSYPSESELYTELENRSFISLTSEADINNFADYIRELNENIIYSDSYSDDKKYSDEELEAFARFDSKEVSADVNCDGVEDFFDGFDILVYHVLKNHKNQNASENDYFSEQKWNMLEENGDVDLDGDVDDTDYELLNSYFCRNTLTPSVALNEMQEHLNKCYLEKSTNSVKTGDNSQIFDDLAENITVIKGDANLDGKLTVADSVAILQHIANRDKYGLKPQGLINADVDGEAGVTANDARVLQEWDANK